MTPVELGPGCVAHEVWRANLLGGAHDSQATARHEPQEEDIHNLQPDGNDEDGNLSMPRRR
jgi:hypothetical protein